MKWFLWLLILFFSLPFVAAGICEDHQASNCTILTPVINCTDYNYTIINETGDIVTQGNLTPLEDQIYYFNFSEETGGYIIELCDQSTREIIVGGGSNMFIAIMIGILGVVFAMFYLGSILDKQHSAIKLLMIIVGLFILLSGLALNENIINTDTDNIITITSGSYTAMIWVVVFVVAYFLVYYIFSIAKSIKSKRRYEND